MLPTRMFRTLSTELRAEMRAKFARRKVTSAADYASILGDFLPAYESVTHRDYVRMSDIAGRKLLLLRHDVDHDFETALLMAKWESQRELHATYCVLHTAWYYGVYQDGRYEHTREVVDFCRTLQDLGHEVNFHNNAVTVALEHGIDPMKLLKREIEFLRSSGVDICGSSTHGDRICRELNFGNFELFSEAVKPDRGGVRVVQSDAGHPVTLGLASYRELGLEYEAYDIARDIYITDSGGRLRCTRDAPGRRSFGRHDPSRSSVVGILTHPIWWNFSDVN